MSIREDLKAYLDGELSPQRAEEVRAAIESDPELKKEVEALRAISNTFRLVAPASQPVGLDQTLEALRKAQPVKRNTGRPLWGWALAGATVLAVAATCCEIVSKPARSSRNFAQTR